MTTLAVYDKRFGKFDRKADEYYRADYIYKKNSSMRVGVIIGFMLLMCFYAVNIIFISDVNFLMVDLKVLAIKICAMLVAVLVIYTLLGTYINGRQYDAAQKRLIGYKGLVKRLDNIIREEISKDHGKTSGR